jgi:hypothetical protein
MYPLSNNGLSRKQSTLAGVALYQDRREMFRWIVPSDKSADNPGRNPGRNESTDEEK